MGVERDSDGRGEGSGENPGGEGSVGGAEQDGGDMEGGPEELFGFPWWLSMK